MMEEMKNAEPLRTTGSGRTGDGGGSGCRREKRGGGF